MKLGTYVAAAVNKLEENDIFSGKTNIQKTIYFSLPAKQRDKYFHAYHYGPYCGLVQEATASLIGNGILKYQGRRLRVNSKWRVKQVDDLMIDRIGNVSRFFAERKITGTKDIARLAKVHLLSRSRNSDARKDLSAYVQRQARFLGWSELAKTDREKIEKYVQLSDAIDAELDASSCK